MVKIAHQTSERSIGNLRPFIVPHEEWILRRWYSHTPLWYYHVRQPMPSLNLSRRFYREVDPDLRQLCKSLHDRRIATGPSCQGHFYSRDHFMRIWEQIRQEASEIRNDGLTVTNSETSEPFTFQDPNFELPWSQFNEFYDEIAAHQGNGYLSMVLSPVEESAQLRPPPRSIDSSNYSILFDEFLSRLLRAPLFHIRVKPRDAVDRRALWNEVANLLDVEMRR